jgi:hypothetical protein
MTDETMRKKEIMLFTEESHHIPRNHYYKGHGEGDCPLAASSKTHEAISKKSGR